MAVQKNKKSLGGSWGLLGVAAVIGIGAFYLTNTYLVNKEASLRATLLGQGSQGMMSVVVATADLQPGDVVGSGNMAVVELMGEHVSNFAVTPDIFKNYQGNVLDRPMSKGEPLLAHFMAGKIIERFSDLLEDGDRAVTIEIDELATDSYMLTAGDFVDIFLLMDMPKPGAPGESGGAEGEEKVLMPLLQKVKVIALGPRPLLSTEHEFIRPMVGGEENDYGTITVAVKVMDAAKLEMGREIGKFVFMLRNSKDTENKSIQAINQAILASLGLGNSVIGFYQYYAASMVSSGSLLSRNQQIGSILQASGNQGRVLLKSLPRVPEDKSIPVNSVIDAEAGEDMSQ